MDNEITMVATELVLDPPSVVDFAAHMFSADHGTWAEIWPDPRERWRWLLWMARVGDLDLDAPPRNMTCPPFEHEGRRVRLRGLGTTAAFADHVAWLRGVELG